MGSGDRRLHDSALMGGQWGGLNAEGFWKLVLRAHVSSHRFSGGGGVGRSSGR